MVAKRKPGLKTDNPMDTMLRVRINKNTLKKLKYSAKELNTSRSEVIRKGIHKIYDDLKK